MNKALDELIAPFIGLVASGQIEVYNEFSLQHELGIFLRNNPLKNYLVQFERNVTSLFPNSVVQFTKREIDIAVFSADRKELKWAIELKYPRNGQYPEQMFSFCRDIVFAEELRKAGFLHTGLLIFADDDLFWKGRHKGYMASFEVVSRYMAQF